MKFLFALLLLAFGLFCVFGFFASGELSGSEEMAWRAGYATLGLTSFVAMLLLLRPDRSTDQD